MDIKEIQNRKSSSVYRHPWELARIEIIIRMLKELTKDDDTSKISLIDIGCGDLFVLDSLNESLKFGEIFGIDVAFTEEIINTLECNYSTSQITLSKELSKLDVSNNNKTIILLLDVIEHIENDKEFLNNLLKQNFVDNNTHFVITVPSYQSMFCSHDRFLVHYRRYSNSSLKKVLKDTNFEIIKSGYFFFSLLPFRIITVIKETFFKKIKIEQKEGTELTDWDHGIFATYLVKYILLTDYFVGKFFLKLKIKTPGLSNFVVAKKRY